ncbi:MAG: right-handed parallel beta-helix repeat-containing protein [Candidatus Sumerlaeaceae bacterium]
MKTTVFLAASFALINSLHAAELHVTPQGRDTNPGTRSKPLRTIQRAADIARPGDQITVHGGTYRERIDPPVGGTSDKERIVYQAAPGERVEIKGSEVVKNWEKVQDGVWKVTLPNSFFGDFNPYSDVITGNWFHALGRTHHTGAVYLDGEWLAEAAKLDDVLKPAGANPLWYGKVDEENTTIWAQFHVDNLNDKLVEINVRRAVFYPSRTGINYLAVRGFTLRHAAPPWAPPTAEQVALIGTHWSKGWIIEDNVISHSACSGLSLGKYGDEWDNKGESAEGYVSTIQRALKNGWNKETIGHHVVRNNTISHCEQAGIVGSLGAVFSTITGNSIHDIHVRQAFGGAEQAGIKIHGAIDCTIARNHIYRCNRGIWLDWMGQGTQVSRNLLHDNVPNEDLFLEVNHGPLLIDNNVSLSTNSLTTWSQGCAYVHNLFGGLIKRSVHDARVTPFMRAHSTELAGMHDNPSGDERFYNNIFMRDADSSVYDGAKLPVSMQGNVYFGSAKPSTHEKKPLLQRDADPRIGIKGLKGAFYLQTDSGSVFAEEGTGVLVTTELLGKAAIPDLPFETPAGAPIRVTTDYFGKQRDSMHPTPGPLEKIPGSGTRIKVW